jgi:hypothetical protein
MNATITHSHSVCDTQRLFWLVCDEPRVRKSAQNTSSTAPRGRVAQHIAIVPSLSLGIHPSPSTSTTAVCISCLKMTSHHIPGKSVCPCPPNNSHRLVLPVSGGAGHLQATVFQRLHLAEQNKQINTHTADHVISPVSESGHFPFNICILLNNTTTNADNNTNTHNTQGMADTCATTSSST